LGSGGGGRAVLKNPGKNLLCVRGLNFASGDSFLGREGKFEIRGAVHLPRKGRKRVSTGIFPTKVVLREKDDPGGGRQGSERHRKKNKEDYFLQERVGSASI